MNLFALHVGELLVQKDKELYQAMQRAFGIPAARRRASSSADSASEAEEEGQLSFHKRLRNLIQPYVRKMLVGEWIDATYYTNVSVYPGIYYAVCA